MHVEWYGQSAFRLSTDEAAIFIDPIGDLSAAAARGLKFEYPPLVNVTADLLLVTHEHGDHNGVDSVGGNPTVLRSTAGRLQSPLGEVVAVASEHDSVAGTERGPNTIFVFEFDGIRVAHFGDFGQNALREEQAAAIGQVDLLFLPVGGGPTIGALEAPAIIARVGARWVVPMHYRTPRISFLATADEFLAGMSNVEHCSSPVFDTDQLAAHDRPLAVVPAAP